MRKIYRIPFVGKIFRIIDFLKGLPLRMEIWERELNNTQQKLVSDEKIIKEKIKIQQDELTHEREQFRKNYDFVTSEIENLKREITGAKEKCKDLEHIKIPQAFEKALANIHPTIWGEREKLHISPRAAVFPCFFNTNSGEIFIGDYTFAGSNVNILAGSHDMHLEGLPRRDAEIKQGCDITIGKGVWLASGCTILGPCKIGDNAVVASGAVVVPNTNIPSNAVYAGIPAKKVKEIETNTKKENSYILQAMEREKGVLFIEGWSDKRGTIYNEKIIMGHIYERTNAIIYTFLKQIKVLIHKNIEEPIEISVKWKDKVIKEKIEENDMTFYWSIEKNDREINELKVNCSENAIDKLLICIL